MKVPKKQKAYFWESRCPSVYGGDEDHMAIRCQLILNHPDLHWHHRKLHDGSETTSWDTSEDTAHKK